MHLYVWPNLQQPLPYFWSHCYAAQVWLRCLSKALAKLQLEVWPNSYRLMLQFWSNFIILLKSDLSIPQKLKLSCSLRCDQIYINHCYCFGHTLVQHKWPTNQLQLLKSCLPEAGLLNKRSSLAVALGVTKVLVVIVTNLVTLYCTAQVWLRYSTNPSFWMLWMKLTSFSK